MSAPNSSYEQPWVDRHWIWIRIAVTLTVTVVCFAGSQWVANQFHDHDTRLAFSFLLGVLVGFIGVMTWSALDD